MIPALSLLIIACASVNAADRTFEIVNAAAASDPIVAHSLREGITELQGSGGNFTVLSGPDGTFVVDSGIAVSKDKIRAALDTLGAEPVKYVVNTHWHWDHANGDAWLHEGGATIVATPNTVKYLTTASRVEEREHTFPSVVGAGVPTELLTAEKVYRFDGETIVVSPLKPSHTDGHLFVYFKKAELRDYLRMLIAVRSKVAALKTQGRSLAEVIAENPTAPFDEKWGTFIVTPARFTTVVYKGL